MTATRCSHNKHFMVAADDKSL